MKDWIEKNKTWITFIGGLLIGFYLAVLKYESSLEVIQSKIMDVKDDVHDLKVLIQNKVLTRVKE